MSIVYYLCHHEVITWSIVGLIVGGVFALVIKDCCYQQRISD